MRTRIVIALSLALAACGAEPPEDNQDPSPDYAVTGPGVDLRLLDRTTGSSWGRMRPPGSGRGGTGGDTGGTGGTTGGTGGDTGTGGTGGTGGDTGGTGGTTGGTGGDTGGTGGDTGGTGGTTGGTGGDTGGTGGTTGGTGGDTGGTGGTTGGTGGTAGGSATACAPSTPQGPVYYVATNGSDSSGTGTSSAPFATIGNAVTRVADGSTILVRPGEYYGLTKIDRKFAAGITVRSEQPYQARLRNNGPALRCFYGTGITVEGFDIAHSGPGASALVVQIQDVNGDGGCSRITLRNNILHDSYNNDILKINNAATDVLVEYNILYNQSGSDEHIDINSVENVTIQHNLFFNDFAGSGRSNPKDTSSFVVVKDSNGSDDRFLGSRNVAIRGNVFLHYEGGAGAPFLLLGEDGHPYYEARGVIVENNLMLGDNTDPMRAAFGCKGVADVVFRNNTISGDLPSSAFAMRLNVEGANKPNQNIQFFNNLWSDPTGTMNRFATAPFGETASFTLHNNAYWNGGKALPYSANDLVNPESDAKATLGNPGLNNPTNIALPRWNPQTGKLGDGSSNVCEAFVKLVEGFGVPSASSVLVDRAESATASATDILGRPRGSSPDIGAVER